jgi:iron complex outermembrane receptor protein
VGSVTSKVSFHWCAVVRLLAGTLMTACLPFAAYAGALEESVRNPRIDEIVTTGVRERPLAELPRSANIITAEDIALSPAANIVDLLAREANLNLRSFNGDAKSSGVDIRGQGDTYRSNVLVMVDGIRLNSADLSGADYSSIPLDSVDRIEVIRGANTVRYGSGAVGGVINIITNSDASGTRLNMKARAGSFSTRDFGLNAANNTEMYSVGMNASYYDSEGYRDNGGLETTDLQLNGGVSPFDWFSAELTGSIHRDEYGLPGGVSYADFNGSDSARRSTRYSEAGGETDDDRARLDLSFGTEATGVLGFTGSLRDRENRYQFSGASNPPSEIHEDDTRFVSQYDKSFSVGNRALDLTLGLDLAQIDYRRDDFNGAAVLSDSKQGDVRQTAWFAAADIELLKSLKLFLGYRSDKFRDEGRVLTLSTTLCDDPVYDNGTLFDCNDPGGFRTGLAETSRTDTWRNSAVEAGLVFQPTDETNFFLSYAQSFRNPNIDELLLSPDSLDPLDPGASLGSLKPQKADHVDAGVRQLFGSDVEWDFSLFYSRTENEILFAIPPGSLFGVNFNSPEPVRRVGGETSVRWNVIPALMLSANAGYTHARFSGTDAEIPLVPEWTGGIAMQWTPAQNWTWNVSGAYVGERFNGLDYSNSQYRKLDDYQVVDTRLSYEVGGLQLYAEANNIFDEVYAPTAYGGDYYPMPGRNYFAGVVYRLQL